jgi:protein OS-9
MRTSQFRCDATPTDRISLIKETSICQYRMVISTPRLCNDVVFHPPKAAAPHPIACHPVMNEESIPAYLDMRAVETKAEKAEAEKLANRIAQEILNEFKAIMGGTKEKSKGKDKKDGKDDKDGKDVGEADITKEAAKPTKLKKKYIAGIEVGGHNILPEGTKLEKGAVVGGGIREKVLVTIARSDGYVADEQELAKLDIKYGKELDTIKQEVERVAKGADWQIDVVETARGKELRGIIGDPKKKDSTKKGSTGSSKGQKSEDEEEGEEEEIGDEDDEKSFEDSDDEWEEGSEEGYKEEL